MIAILTSTCAERKMMIRQKHSAHERQSRVVVGRVRVKQDSRDDRARRLDSSEAPRSGIYSPDGVRALSVSPARTAVRQRTQSNIQAERWRVPTS